MIEYFDLINESRFVYLDSNPTPFLCLKMLHIKGGNYFKEFYDYFRSCDCVIVTPFEDHITINIECDEISYQVPCNTSQEEFLKLREIHKCFLIIVDGFLENDIKQPPLYKNNLEIKPPVMVHLKMI